jgi:hypothetical protein
MSFTEEDAIAELTASYDKLTIDALYCERATLNQELDSARDRTERRLCTDHLAVLDAEMIKRGLPLDPPPLDSQAAA